MVKKKETPSFECTKCENRFMGLDSFHGEYRLLYGGISDVKLCNRCLEETRALWNDEFKFIERQIKQKISNCVSMHGIDKYADAKRTVYEEILDMLVNHSVLFNGENQRSHWNRDMTQLEISARKTIHDEFGINFSDQVKLLHRYTVDGLMHAKGKNVVLEFDGPYHHSTEEQKYKDEMKDYTLAAEGYRVLRISSDVVYNDKSLFRSLVLDALYGKRKPTSKSPIPDLVTRPSTQEVHCKSDL